MNNNVAPFLTIISRRGYGQHFPTSERVVRPLVGLDEDKQRKAWDQAVEIAQKDGKKHVTATIVEAVVKKLKPRTSRGGGGGGGKPSSNGHAAPPPPAEQPAPPPPAEEPKYAYTCPNCKGHEQDEDGDCKACHEPTGDAPAVEEMGPEDDMKAYNNTIEAFCRELTKLAEEKMPKGPWLKQNGRRDQALQKIKDACSTLRTCKGSAVCPKCNGEGCKRCQDTGYVTKLVLEQLK